jgi:translation initiation factor IF-3
MKTKAEIENKIASNSRKIQEIKDQPKTDKCDFEEDANDIRQLVGKNAGLRWVLSL